MIERRGHPAHASMAPDMPPRSRLYCLAPLGMGTAEIESFTSYVTRLAWAYRVSPRLLVAQEIIPKLKRAFHYHVSVEKLGSFCRRQAMTLNGAGETAAEWTDTLEQLTMRGDLRHLTVQAWASGFAPRWLLRRYPGWCPACYQEWQEKGQPIYQPLLWMLQVVTTCLRHRRWLEERCPSCQKNQSTLALTTTHGFCTQCSAWLGTHPGLNTPHEIDDETLSWQEWVVRTIDELRQAGMSGSLPWKQLLVGLAACVTTIGSAARVAEMIGMSDANLLAWLKGKVTPTLNRLLELCYVLDVSPLQLMTTDPEVLSKTIQTSEVHRPPRPRRPEYHRIDAERAFVLIQAVLEGSEAPLPVFEIERRLGLGPATLKYRFPHECTLITAQYRAHLSEQARLRTEKKCEVVREVMLSLHAQGIYPSAYLLSSLLSNLHILRKPEGQATWYAVLRELGLEPRRRKKRETD